MSTLATRLSAHSSALICLDTDIRGEVTIGAGSVVHPRAAILAVGGPIVIGRNCVLEETAVLVNRRKEPMIIGDDNHFMIGCRIESPSIGDSNTFYPRSKIASVGVSHHCTLGADTVLLPKFNSENTLPAYSVIYGLESSIRTWDKTAEGNERTLRAKHVEYLREIIPKYNRMRAV